MIILIFMSIIKNSVAQNADCTDALELTQYGDFEFQTGNDFGLQEMVGFTCNGNLQFDLVENSSIWLKFSTCTEGIVQFLLTPTESNDLDFVVFKLVGEDDCQSMEAIRCMYSGQSQNQNSDHCLGVTGLDLESTDDFEGPGC